MVEVTPASAAMTLALGLQQREAAPGALRRLLTVGRKATPYDRCGRRPYAWEPGVIVREDGDRFRFMRVGYLLSTCGTVVEDAVRHLGGEPVGVDVPQILDGAGSGRCRRVVDIFRKKRMRCL